MARLTSGNDVSGVVSDIIPPNKAFISFFHDSKLDSALLTHAQFYHEGRRIPTNHTLSNYLRSGMTVKFSCEECREKKKDSPCPWIVTSCWVNDKNPLNRATVLTGIDDAMGKVKKVGKRHGVISVFDSTRHARDVLFFASRFYVDGKRFAAGKCLTQELQPNEPVYLDAIPSIPEENDEKCKWFATCVYKGRRPKIFHDNGDNGHKTHRGEAQNLGEGNQSEFKIQYPEIVYQYMHSPHTVFIMGRGEVLRILDEEFGIIMGEIKKNVFQTIFFHRKQFFMTGMSLSDCDIRALLCEEDRVKFIAVGAPAGFATDLIAVQLAIQKEPPKD